MTPDDPRHGTYAGYVQGCRCNPCRKANATYTKARRDHNRTIGLAPDSPRHGQPSSYINYGCSCPRCMAAHYRQQAAIYLRTAERLEKKAAMRSG